MPHKRSAAGAPDRRFQWTPATNPRCGSRCKRASSTFDAKRRPAIFAPRRRCSAIMASRCTRVYHGPAEIACVSPSACTATHARAAGRKALRETRTPKSGTEHPLRYDARSTPATPPSSSCAGGCRRSPAKHEPAPGRRQHGWYIALDETVRPAADRHPTSYGRIHSRSTGDDVSIDDRRMSPGNDRVAAATCIRRNSDYLTHPVFNSASIRKPT